MSPNAPPGQPPILRVFGMLLFIVVVGGVFMLAAGQAGEGSGGQEGAAGEPSEGLAGQPDDPEGEDDPASSETPEEEPTQPAEPTPAATEPPSTAEMVEGSPFSESAFVASLESAGLSGERQSEPLACPDALADGLVYDVTPDGGGDSQEVVLWVYASSDQRSEDWATADGTRPQFRHGQCLEDATAIYWNQNALLGFERVEDRDLRQEIVDAFLALS